MDGLEAVKALDDDRIEALYRDLTRAFPHPFDWMGLLEKPPFWRRRWVRAHRKLVGVFAKHGFALNRRVAIRYMLGDGQTQFEDAGGAICRRLRHALDGQTFT